MFGRSGNHLTVTVPITFPEAALGATIRVPTLVNHGTDDPLVPKSAGREVARIVPGAKLVEFDGMGHDLPAALIPQIVAAIADHCLEKGLEKGSEPISGNRGKGL